MNAPDEELNKKIDVRKSAGSFISLSIIKLSSKRLSSFHYRFFPKLKITSEEHKNART
jgi:hypothetical protein